MPNRRSQNLPQGKRLVAYFVVKQSGRDLTMPGSDASSSSSLSSSQLKIQRLLGDRKPRNYSESAVVEAKRLVKERHQLRRRQSPLRTSKIPLPTSPNTKREALRRYIDQANHRTRSTTPPSNPVAPPRSPVRRYIDSLNQQQQQQQAIENQPKSFTPTYNAKRKVKNAIDSRTTSRSPPRKGTKGHYEQALQLAKQKISSFEQRTRATADVEKLDQRVDQPTPVLQTSFVRSRRFFADTPSVAQPPIVSELLPVTASDHPFDEAEDDVGATKEHFDVVDPHPEDERIQSAVPSIEQDPVVAPAIDVFPESVELIHVSVDPPPPPPPPLPVAEEPSSLRIRERVVLPNQSVEESIELEVISALSPQAWVETEHGAVAVASEKTVGTDQPSREAFSSHGSIKDTRQDPPCSTLLPEAASSVVADSTSVKVETQSRIGALQAAGTVSDDPPADAPVRSEDAGSEIVDSKSVRLDTGSSVCAADADTKQATTSVESEIDAMVDSESQRGASTTKVEPHALLHTDSVGPIDLRESLIDSRSDATLTLSPGSMMASADLVGASVEVEAAFDAAEAPQMRRNPLAGNLVNPTLLDELDSMIGGRSIAVSDKNYLVPDEMVASKDGSASAQSRIVVEPSHDRLDLSMEIVQGVTGDQGSPTNKSTVVPGVTCDEGSPIKRGIVEAEDVPMEKEGVASPVDVKQEGDAVQALSATAEVFVEPGADVPEATAPSRLIDQPEISQSPSTGQYSTKSDEISGLLEIVEEAPSQESQYSVVVDDTRSTIELIQESRTNDSSVSVGARRAGSVDQKKLHFSSTATTTSDGSGYHNLHGRGSQLTTESECETLVLLQNSSLKSNGPSPSKAAPHLEEKKEEEDTLFDFESSCLSKERDDTTFGRIDEICSEELLGEYEQGAERLLVTASHDLYPLLDGGSNALSIEDVRSFVSLLRFARKFLDGREPNATEVSQVLSYAQELGLSLVLADSLIDASGAMRSSCKRSQATIDSMNDEDEAQCALFVVRLIGYLREGYTPREAPDDGAAEPLPPTPRTAPSGEVEVEANNGFAGLDFTTTDDEEPWWEVAARLSLSVQERAAFDRSSRQQVAGAVDVPVQDGVSPVSRPNGQRMVEDDIAQFWKDQEATKRSPTDDVRFTPPRPERVQSRSAAAKQIQAKTPLKKKDFTAWARNNQFEIMKGWYSRQSIITASSWPQDINAVSITARLRDGGATTMNTSARRQKLFSDRWSQAQTRRDGVREVGVDVNSLYKSASVGGRGHSLDEDPWECRDVKQRFLSEQSAVNKNWFGSLTCKKGNTVINQPVCRPKSMEMPVAASEWTVEWYQRPEIAAVQAALGSDYAEYFCPLDDGEDDDGKWDEVPECGRLRNTKLRVGERLSRVAPDLTSSLKRSKWRRKHFPHGNFPY